MQVICDNCDEIYFNRIFDPDATVEYPYGPPNWIHHIEF